MKKLFYIFILICLAGCTPNNKSNKQKPEDIRYAEKPVDPMIEILMLDKDIKN